MEKKVDEITREILVELMSYHEITGQLFWRERGGAYFKDYTAMVSWNKKYAGKEVSPKSPCFKILGATFQKSRAVWLIHTGYLPSQDNWKIRCVNMINTDTRIENLACVSNSVSCKNRHRTSKTSSGIWGVFWNVKSEAYEAQWSLVSDEDRNSKDGIRRKRKTKQCESMMDAYWVRKLNAEINDYHFKMVKTGDTLKTPLPKVVSEDVMPPRRTHTTKTKQAISARQVGQRLGLDNPTNKGTVYGVHKTTNETVSFPTAADASRMDSRFRCANINQCINGDKKSHAGFIWTR